MTIDTTLPTVTFVKRIPCNLDIARACFARTWTTNANDWRGHAPGTCMVIGFSIQPWPRMKLGHLVVTTIGLWDVEHAEEYPREPFIDAEFGDEFQEPVDGAVVQDVVDDVLLAVNADGDADGHSI